MKDLTPCICERCNAEHNGGNYFLCPDCEIYSPSPDEIVTIFTKDFAGPPTFDIFTLKDIPKMETR